MNKLLVQLSFLFCFLYVPSMKAQVAILPSSEVLNRPFGEIDKKLFQAPDKIFYPETWFHFIGGNVSLKGITADLEAISNAGFSGVQLFHGQFGSVWPGTDSQIICLSPNWDNAVRHVGNECKRLGLRFTMQGCPGWAMAGGPWIKPENAMRNLVWIRKDVDSKMMKTVLPKPQPSNEEWRDYRDIVVLAFPTPTGDDTGEPIKPEIVKSNVECNWHEFFTGAAAKELKLPPSPKNTPYVIDLSYKNDTVIRTIELSSVQQMNHNWCYEPGVHIKMEALMPDGQSFKVLDTDMPQSAWQDFKPISLSCVEVRGVKNYRINIENEHDITLAFIKLYSAARKNNWESEAAWTLRAMERRGDSIRYSSDKYINADRIIDISDKMDKDGVLDWMAPDGGKWTVLRIGHVNAGYVNSPAPAEGTGWECDKFSAKGSSAQFDGYLGRLTAENGPLAGGLLNGVLFDSWECVTQTWTDAMEQEFETRTSYPLKKWMPALLGYVVDDPEKTSCFLNDWRRTINDLFVNEFYGNMAKRAKERGMSISYETAAGDVFPADIMEYYKYADVPMCEFWQPFTQGFVGSLNFKPIKPTASAARMYGKPRIAAESFTSFSHTWDESFQLLKEVANINTIEGVTHLIFHTYTHNPQIGFLPPGTSFSGANIGTPFLRGQTWWKYMYEFNTYLARCSYMLERGKPVSDVLWYLGDEIDHKPNQEIAFPAGYKYDYCNTDALLNRLSVADGRIVTPEGISYAVLWLPETNRMLPETIEKIYDLIDKGATVIGNAPSKLATLVNRNKAEKAISENVKKIWKQSGINRIGKGCIVSGLPIDKALRKLNMQPDVMQTEALWSHRRIGNVDWYYVCAPKGKGFKGTLDFRMNGNVQIWDPVNGQIKNVDYKTVDGRTQVTLDLAAAGNCFVVFNADKTIADADNSLINQMQENSTSQTLSLNEKWNLSFPQGWGVNAPVEIANLVPWKDLNISTEGKAFSGTVDYSTSFKIKNIDKSSCYVLDMGRVERIAEIYLNGSKVGVCWAEPYIIDITKYLKKGDNKLLIKVTNTWFNRLVYDANQPESSRKTWVLNWPKKDAPLRDSGLLGPVCISINKKSTI